MPSQPGQQTIALHILSNISQSKSNQVMKFGELIEYNKRNIFVQKACKKWGRETSSRSLFIKALFDVRASGLQHMLNFDFSEQGLGLASPPHFVYDFSREVYILLTDHIPLSD